MEDSMDSYDGYDYCRCKRVVLDNELFVRILVDIFVYIVYVFFLLI